MDLASHTWNVFVDGQIKETFSNSTPVLRLVDHINQSHILKGQSFIVSEKDSYEKAVDDWFWCKNSNVCAMNF
ncbi:hypothetical protein P4V47_06765 [Brevibacillus laterosporus]|uniref:hypothetical protein n=1 Tax=Brevibacillus laterosporus TaxID=1465 RepID=UPI002E1DDFAF|nr:hypothetical protein [Brevibacillus laterosporus]